MVKSLDEVIERLQYKADNIKAKLEPSYFTECIDYLKNLSSKESKWTPCSKRLPDYYKEVLGCDYNGEMSIIALYDDNIFGNVWRQWNGGFLRLDVIIAWQPLPIPYGKAKKMKGK